LVLGRNGFMAKPPPFPLKYACDRPRVHGKNSMLNILLLEINISITVVLRACAGGTGQQ